MYRPRALPERLPVFPLEGAILLPRAELPLNIFEPRYLAMVEDALASEDRLIGVIQPAGGNAFHSVGGAGRITAFREREDGRYLISLTGVSRFRLAGAPEAGFRPYLLAPVDWAPYAAERSAPETVPDLDRERLFALLARYLDGHGLSTDWDALREADDEHLINALSMLCPFRAEEKQALVEAADLSARAAALMTLLAFAADDQDRETLQ